MTATRTAPPVPGATAGAFADPFDGLDLAALRRRTSIKWRQYPEDVLPLWVAEMDVHLAEPVVEAIVGAARLGDTGYPVAQAADRCGHRVRRPALGLADRTGRGAARPGRHGRRRRVDRPADGAGRRGRRQRSGLRPVPVVRPEPRATGRGGAPDRRRSSRRRQPRRGVHAWPEPAAGPRSSS